MLASNNTQECHDTTDEAGMQFLSHVIGPSIFRTATYYWLLLLSLSRSLSVLPQMFLSHQKTNVGALFRLFENASHRLK